MELDEAVGHRVWLPNRSNRRSFVYINPMAKMGVHENCFATHCKISTMRRRNCDIYGALGSYRHVCGAGDFSVVVEHDMSSTVSSADTYVLASLSPYDYCRTAIWGITFGVSEQRSRTNDSLWFLM